MVQKYEVLVIGGSAGSIQVVKKILSNLGNDISIPIIIGMHRMAHDDSSNLLRVIQYSTQIPVVEPVHMERFLPNQIYLAPADHHLIIEPNKTANLSRTPLVHYSRPSIDVLFMSIGQVYGKKAIGVLVTGANRDGAMGLKMIQECGGTILVQDPKDCFIETMTREAIEITDVDYVLSADELAPKIKELLNK